MKSCPSSIRSLIGRAAMIRKHPRYGRMDIGKAAGNLRALAWQIRGMGFLLERHGGDSDPPLDPQEVYLGIGMILYTLSRRVYRIARAMDEHEVATAWAAKDDEE